MTSRNVEKERLNFITFSIYNFFTNYRALAVVTSHSEIMLKDWIHDAADTEGWFDDIRHVFFYVHSLLVPFNFQHIGRHDVRIIPNCQDVFAVVFQRLFNLNNGCRFQLGKGFHDIFRFLLERFAHSAFVRHSLENVNRLGFRQLLFCYQTYSGRLGMLRQIVGRAIGTADTFHPSLEIYFEIEVTMDNTCPTI